MFALEFLAVGTLGFYAILVIAALLLSVAIDRNNPGYATIVALVTLGVLSILGNFNPFSYAIHNPLESIGWVAGYFAAGAVWMWAKCGWWLKKSKRRIDEIRQTYPGQSLNQLSTFFREERLPYKFPVRISDYKTRLFGWLAAWPASVIGTLLNDPIRIAFEEIYALLGGSLQRLSDRIFRDINASVK